MKLIRIIIKLFVLILIITQTAFSQNKGLSNSKVRNAFYIGTATNVTVNIKAMCSFRLRIENDTIYTLDIQIDNLNLYGKCRNLKAALVYMSPADSSLCIQFKGSIEMFGDDISGLELTMADYVQSVVIDKIGNMTGTYYIKTNEALAKLGINYDQFGTFNTVCTRKE